MEKLLTQKYFNGGISHSDKEGVRGSFSFGQKLEIFEEPTNLTIMPTTAKRSGTTVVDLVKWIVSGTPGDTNKYFYGDTGNIYKETSAGAWSVLRTVANSGGQGMDLYDDYIYYVQDTQIGIYGPLSSSPSFDDDWQTGLNNTATTNFAPAKAFMGGIAFGHGNQLAWWDGAVYDADRLTIPPGFNIRCLTTLDEYLVLGAWRGTSITDTEDGYLFFWDGTSTTYNYAVPVEDGAVNAIISSRNRLLSMLGSSGNLYMGYGPFQKIDRIPFITNTKYIDVYPGAMTAWKGMALIGIAGATDSSAVYQGVYQYGAESDKYSEVLNYAYPISTGNAKATNISIGCVKGIGDELYIGWKDNTSYGVDRIVQTASPYTSATYESLIFDAGVVSRDKLAKVLKVTHKALVTGESVQLGYKINRASSYTTGDANTTVGSTETRLNIPVPARFREFQFEIILGTSVATSPTITEAALIYDDLDSERKL